MFIVLSVAKPSNFKRSNIRGGVVLGFASEASLHENVGGLQRRAKNRWLCCRRSGGSSPAKLRCTKFSVARSWIFSLDLGLFCRLVEKFRETKYLGSMFRVLSVYRKKIFCPHFFVFIFRCFLFRSDSAALIGHPWLTVIYLTARCAVTSFVLCDCT